MKVTLQVTGSLALVFWAIVVFIPIIGGWPLVTQMVWWISGEDNASDPLAIYFVIVSVVMLGYAIVAFRSASRRE
jgi:quinol-cytochrome oxidoreductase complex cytochrome b subunit